MAEDDTDFARDSAIILDKKNVNVPFMPGELPGSEPSGDMEMMFGGGIVEPPIPPKKLLKAVATNGQLAAVCHAVAEGCAGVKYVIEPRFNVSSIMKENEQFRLEDPATWPPEFKSQRDQLQVFIQAGFLGDGAKSLRQGFYKQEHDRVILGWGGVRVMRHEIMDRGKNMPSSPRGLGRFEAVSARFTRPDRRATMTPVPIALEDGTIFWIEEPRFFRRLRLQLSNGRHMWFKEYGDWRSMSSRTGKYSTGVRRKPPTRPGQPGQYTPGKVPEDHPAAQEVMHWATSFPGAHPYGMSGWHSELAATDAWREHIALLLAYLKSGLHSVILAAANRPFESATANAAVDKIDELGRGRKGLGSLVTISLIPADSDVQRSGGDIFGSDTTADRGRLVLHELNTKLPGEMLTAQLQDALSERFSNAERIPAILLGRTESYNFATASAAWTVVNRLRFGPHHESREAFLDRILVERGITMWRVKVISPEWDEKEPISTVAQVSGTLGGISVNRAMDLLGTAMDFDVKPVEEWWGNLPMPLVTSILNSTNPKGTAQLLGVELTDEQLAGSVTEAASNAIDNLNNDAEDAAANRQR